MKNKLFDTEPCQERSGKFYFYTLHHLRHIERSLQYTIGYPGNNSFKLLTIGADHQVYVCAYPAPQQSTILCPKSKE